MFSALFSLIILACRVKAGGTRWWRPWSQAPHNTSSTAVRSTARSISTSAVAWQAPRESRRIVAGARSLCAPMAGLIRLHCLELLMASRELPGMQKILVVFMSLKRSRTAGTSYSWKDIKPMSVCRRMMEARFYRIHAFLWVQFSDSFPIMASHALQHRQVLILCKILISSFTGHQISGSEKYVGRS